MLSRSIHTFSFKSSAGFFQPQNFQMKTREIKDFTSWLWLAAIMNPETSHQRALPVHYKIKASNPSPTTNFNPTHAHRNACMHVHTNARMPVHTNACMHAHAHMQAHCKLQEGKGHESYLPSGILPHASRSPQFC